MKKRSDKNKKRKRKRQKKIIITFKNMIKR